MRNKIKFFVVLLVSSFLAACTKGPTAPPAHPVNEVRNGGLNEQGQFVSVINEVLDHQLSMHPDKRILTVEQIQTLRALLADPNRTHIEFTDEILRDDDGKLVGAVNACTWGYIKVKINRLWWKEDLLAGFDVHRLALHEVLPAIGIPDVNFSFSWRLAMAGYHTGDGLWVKTIEVEGVKYSVRLALNFAKEVPATNVEVLKTRGHCFVRAYFPARFELLVQTESGEVVLGKAGTLSGGTLLERSFFKDCVDEIGPQRYALEEYARPRNEEPRYVIDEHFNLNGEEYFLHVDTRTSGGVIARHGSYVLLQPQPGTCWNGERSVYSLGYPGKTEPIDGGDGAQIWVWTHKGLRLDEYPRVEPIRLLKLSANPGDFLQVRRRPYWDPGSATRITGEYEFHFYDPAVTTSSRVYLVTSWKKRRWPDRGTVAESGTETTETEMWTAGGHRWLASLNKEHQVYVNDAEVGERRFVLDDIALSAVIKIVDKNGEVSYQRGNYSARGRYDIPLGRLHRDFSVRIIAREVPPSFESLYVGTEAID